MAKPDLGTKRACVACSARFYDMAKSPAICPKCGTEQPIDQPRPRRSAGNVVDDKRPKKPAVAPGIEDVEVEVEGVEDVEEEDVMEDTTDLEDDADTIVPEIDTDTDEGDR